MVPSHGTNRGPIDYKFIDPKNFSLLVRPYNTFTTVRIPNIYFYYTSTTELNMKPPATNVY